MDAIENFNSHCKLSDLSADHITNQPCLVHVNQQVNNMSAYAASDVGSSVSGYTYMGGGKPIVGSNEYCISVPYHMVPAGAGLNPFPWGVDFGGMYINVPSVATQDVAMNDFLLQQQQLHGTYYALYDGLQERQVGEVGADASIICNKTINNNINNNGSTNNFVNSCNSAAKEISSNGITTNSSISAKTNNNNNKHTKLVSNKYSNNASQKYEDKNFKHLNNKKANHTENGDVQQGKNLGKHSQTNGETGFNMLLGDYDLNNGAYNVNSTPLGNRSFYVHPAGHGTPCVIQGGNLIPALSFCCPSVNTFTIPHNGNIAAHSYYNARNPYNVDYIPINSQCAVITLDRLEGISKSYDTWDTCNFYVVAFINPEDELQEKYRTKGFPYIGKSDQWLTCDFQKSCFKIPWNGEEFLRLKVMEETEFRTDVVGRVELQIENIEHKTSLRVPIVGEGNQYKGFLIFSFHIMNNLTTLPLLPQSSFLNVKPHNSISRTKTISKKRKEANQHSIFNFFSKWCCEFPIIDIN